MGRPIRNAIAVMAQTAHRGVPVLSSTDPHAWYKGTPPSRENDHSILDRQNKHQIRGVPASASYVGNANASRGIPASAS